VYSITSLIIPPHYSDHVEYIPNTKVRFYHLRLLEKSFVEYAMMMDICMVSHFHYICSTGSSTTSYTTNIPLFAKESDYLSALLCHYLLYMRQYLQFWNIFIYGDPKTKTTAIYLVYLLGPKWTWIVRVRTYSSRNFRTLDIHGTCTQNYKLQHFKYMTHMFATHTVVLTQPFNRESSKFNTTGKTNNGY